MSKDVCTDELECTSKEALFEELRRINKIRSEYEQPNRMILRDAKFMMVGDMVELHVPAGVFAIGSKEEWLDQLFPEGSAPEAKEEWLNTWFPEGSALEMDLEPQVKEDG